MFGVRSILAALAGYFIAKRYPIFGGFILVGLTSLVFYLISNPAAGAAASLLFFAFVFCIIIIRFLPFILGYILGVAFVILFIIGLGSLVSGH